VQMNTNQHLNYLRCISSGEVIIRRRHNRLLGDAIVVKKAYTSMRFIRFHGLSSH
jgi:hypothetical protein